MRSAGKVSTCTLAVALLVALAAVAGCTSSSKSSPSPRLSAVTSVIASALPTYSGPARVMSLKSVAAVAKVNPTVACSIFAGTPVVVSAALFGGRTLALDTAKSVGPSGEVTCAYHLITSTAIDLTVVARPNADHTANSSAVLTNSYRAVNPFAQVILTSSTGRLVLAAPTTKAFATRLLSGISA